jgi:hypothetical protein
VAPKTAMKSPSFAPRSLGDADGRGPGPSWRFWLTAWIHLAVNAAIAGVVHRLGWADFMTALPVVIAADFACATKLRRFHDG